MKKLLFILTFLLFINNISYAQGYTLDNKGYTERYGMVGLYGLMPDFIEKNFKDLSFGGGGFIYYNILNDFWGNFSIGFTSEYVGGAYNGNTLHGYMNMAPISLSLAYMTASDFLNIWAGMGISYNFINFVTRQQGPAKTLYDGVVGGDFFVGAEYIFTNNGRWGAFFEFRYTIAEKAQFHLDNLSENIDTQRFRYTLGFSYHF